MDNCLHDSLWREIKNNVEPQKLSQNEKTEVCIIGAGIAGLTTAYQLLQAGKKVVIISHKKIGENETGNTSAHLSNALDDRYFNIEKMHGRKSAVLAAQSHTDAINWIESLVNQNHIQCDFKRVEGILFNSGDKKNRTLEKEYIAAKRVGLDVHLKGIPHFGKCLIFANQAVFHPLKYLYALAQLVKDKGGKIYEEMQVEKIDQKQLKVTCSNQKTVIAQKIVCATNSQFFSKLSLHFKLIPQRSYVIGIAVPKNSIQNVLYWDNDNPYHYVRVENKDDKQDILIVGGGDHRVGKPPNPAVFKNLFIWAKKYFPLKNAKINYSWSGQIIEPIDYLAYIGINPKNKNFFMVTGDSGNGLTHGTLAGKIITDLILNKPHPWQDVYKISRLPIRSFFNLIKNSLSSLTGYLKLFYPNFSPMPKNGEGKIMSQGMKKIAVYKDEHGNIYKCSGTCAHLGAVLTWNEIEKTWDCPAHGSRFNIEGKALNGPTMKNLVCSKK